MLPQLRASATGADPGIFSEGAGAVIQRRKFITGPQQELSSKRARQSEMNRIKRS